MNMGGCPPEMRFPFAGGERAGKFRSDVFEEEKHVGSDMSDHPLFPFGKYIPAERFSLYVSRVTNGSIRIGPGFPSPIVALMLNVKGVWL